MTTFKNIIITPIKPTSKGLVAFASLDYEQLSLNSIAIYNRPDGNGYRLVYPNIRLINGKEINVFYPTNRNIGIEFERNISKRYNEILDKIHHSDTQLDYKKY